MRHEENIELLRAAISRSGLSKRKFAAQLVVRDERTVRRWLEGTQTIPEVALVKLRILAADGGQVIP